MLQMSLILLLTISNASTHKRFRNATHGPVHGSRIVGGTIALLHEFPHQALLKITTPEGGMMYCGASVLNTTTLVTAGHCVFGISKSAFQILVGGYDVNPDRKYNKKYVQELKAKGILLHPCYDHGEPHFDISLINVTPDIKFNENVMPIRLPRVDEQPKTGDEVTVAGWGYEKYEGSMNNGLMKVVVKISDQEWCKKNYQKANANANITELVLCAREKNKDSCQGDSGGPLMVIKVDDKGCEDKYLAGLVSQGEGCAEEKYPGIYVNVNKFVCWITSGHWPEDVIKCNNKVAPDCPQENRSFTEKPEGCRRPVTATGSRIHINFFILFQLVLISQ